MKSFHLLLIALLFVTCCFAQTTQVNSIYSQMNAERKSRCLNDITVSSKLEAVALTNANNLCSLSTSGFSGYNYFYNSYTTTGTYDFNNLQDRVLSSYNTSESKWICSSDSSTSGSLSDALFYRYSLVSSQTIGCALTTASNCKKTLSGKTYNAYYFVCIYSVYPSSPVISSSNCDSCSGGGSGSGSTTAAPTTKAPTTPTTTPSPSTSKPPATTPTTAAPTTAAPTTKAPTTAPVTTTPSPSTSNSTEQALWLSYHNTARACVGVPALTWDTGLEKDAKAWADYLAIGCSMFHSSATSTPPRVNQGENLFYIMQSSITGPQLIQNGVAMWVDERYDWTCSSNTCSAVCAHYTALVWRNTTKVGCAYSLCKSVANKYQGVCRYTPLGNMNGLNPLAPKACSYNCASNSVRTLSNTTTQSAIATTTSSTGNSDFFSTDYQLVVFVLTAVVVVVVLSIFILLLVSLIKKRQVNEEDYYQALLKK